MQKGPRRSAKSVTEASTKAATNASERCAAEGGNSFAQAVAAGEAQDTALEVEEAAEAADAHLASDLAKDVGGATSCSSSPPVPNPKFPVAVYIGSGDDVSPAWLYPDLVWVLVTMEGLGWWPADSHGGLIEDHDYFQECVEAYMDAAFARHDNYLFLDRGGRDIHIFLKQQFPQTLSSECLAWLALANFVFIKGWQYDHKDLSRLCPHLCRCVCAATCAAPSYLPTVTIPCYDYRLDSEMPELLIPNDELGLRFLHACTATLAPQTTCHPVYYQQEGFCR